MVPYRLNRGFTLLEVMVSVGILGVIMTLIWSTTSQNLRAKDRIEKRDLMFHSVQVAMRKISDDIAMSFLTKTAAPAAAAPAPGEVAPAAEAPTPVFKTFFIGEDRGDQDSVRFTSLSHLRLVKNSKESDQCKISYEVVPNPEEPKQFDIIRKEDVWLDATTDVTAKGFALIEGVTQFNVEYYDERKGDWGKEWSTEKGDWHDKLPIAVRITIGFPDPDDDTKKISMSTAVSVPMSSGPIEL